MGNSNAPSNPTAVVLLLLAGLYLGDVCSIGAGVCSIRAGVLSQSWRLRLLSSKLGKNVIEFLMEICTLRYHSRCSFSISKKKTCACLSEYQEEVSDSLNRNHVAPWREMRR